MRSLPLLLLLRTVPCTLLLLASTTCTAADVCTTLPFHTLSHSCGGVCPTSNHTCAVYAASGPTPCDLVGASPKSVCVTPPTIPSPNCVYQCFAPDKDPILLRFYILFNAPRQTRAPSVAADASGDANLPPYESNEFIRRLGVLELPSFVTKVVLSGGRNEDTATRGDLVDLEIDPLAFSKTPDLTVVGMLNIDLGNRLPDFPPILPVGVRAVDVTNANLKLIPTSLNRLTLVQSISFARNLLTDVPTSLDLPTLKTLFLGENELSSFNVVFPNLEFLDLADNKLEQFPTVVFNMIKLNTVKLSKNPTMAKVLFSTSQYAQLAALEEFSIDAEAMDSTSCRTDQIKQFQRQSGEVCVVTDQELAAFNAKRTRIPSTPSPSQTAASTSDGISRTLLTVLIVVSGLVCVCLGVYGFLCWKKRRRRGENETGHEDSNRQFRLAKMDETAPDSSGVSGSNGRGPFKKARHAALLLSEGSVLGSGQSLWDDDEMLSRQLQLEDIEDVRVLGTGGFAIVWLVRYGPQHRLLASKRLIKDQVTRQKTMNFVLEIKLNMQLNHPNIVPLVGVAWTTETDLQALLEYMPNGDLRSHLEATAPTPWDRSKLQLAIDIAEALVYVHSFSPPLVHRDLKSRNVLLTDDLMAKVCDFGVSRFASANATMTAGVGTGKWLAPEVVAGSKSYDESCDLYAFGVVLSEMDTHQLPYDDLLGPQGHKLPEFAVLQMVAAGQVQPTLRASCPDAIRRLALQCLAFTPAERPAATEVAYTLRQALQEEMSR